MSTVRLKHNHNPLGKAGDVVSVPYGKGIELVRLGVAEYPATAPAAPARPAEHEGAKAELAAARKRVAELDAENRKLKAENAELKQLLEADAGPGKGDDKKADEKPKK